MRLAPPANSTAVMLDATNAVRATTLLMPILPIQVSLGLLAATGTKLAMS